MALQTYSPLRPGKLRKNLWFERGMAIAATVNLALVCFDLTYVPWRNFWLQSNLVIPFTNQKIHIPLPIVDCPDRSVERGKPPRTVQQSIVTCLYDPVKGIEPHRDTAAYLRTVDQLEQQILLKGITAGLQSPEVQQTLAELRRQSETMITLNPFQGANKSGTLERIKSEMRNHVDDRVRVDLSSINAFKVFWSTDSPIYPNFLSPSSYSQEISWFNKTLRPLIATNYFRSISENGQPTNNFWLLDAPFVTLFFLEFLARTFYMGRRYRSLTWLDAIIWRWYDVPLFIPFSLIAPYLALIRILPVTLRLHQAELIDLNEIYARAREGFVASIAEEIAEVVIVQIVNQVQGAIRRGDVTDLLKQTTSRQYIDINNLNEVEAIAKHLIDLILYQVFPKVQPDLAALLHHSVTTILNQSPVYQGITALPGIGDVPGQLTERLVSDLTDMMYQTLKLSLEDSKTTELTTEFLKKVSSTILSEAQQNHNLEEIQRLLSDLLEEIKINYIHRFSEEDSALILDETRQLKERSSYAAQRMPEKTSRT